MTDLDTKRLPEGPAPLSGNKAGDIILVPCVVDVVFKESSSVTVGKYVLVLDKDTPVYKIPWTPTVGRAARCERLGIVSVLSVVNGEAWVKICGTSFVVPIGDLSKP